MPDSRPSQNPESTNEIRGDFTEFLKLHKESKSKSEKVSFCGEEKSKSEVQKSLNELSCADRVVDLTSNQRCEITKKLAQFRESDNLSAGKSVYQEYRELINDKFMEDEDFTDYFESFWVSGKYLQELHDRKVETQFWED